jgi:alkylation response protein AidB-like acyl-CoA dehydrogenase
MSTARSTHTLSRLLRRAEAPSCTTIGEWLPLWRRATDGCRDEGPFAAAIAAALQADRLAWAFFSGYQGALQAAFPESLALSARRVACLCANEAGRKLNDIATRLDVADDVFRLSGSKSWLLACGDDLTLFVLTRAAGGPASGPGSLAIVEIRSSAAGVVVGAPRPQAMVPELPHATVAFHGVRVEPAQVLPGDGYAGYARPFRLREDVFVTGCALAHLLSHAQRAAWPTTWRQRCVAVIAALEACASMPPDDVGTVVRVAGTLAWAGDLIDEVDDLWSEGEAEAARWQRDKVLLELGHDARRQRTLNAWAAVDRVATRDDAPDSADDHAPARRQGRSIKPGVQQ